MPHIGNHPTVVLHTYKIHEPGTPLRPIVDYTGSISYTLLRSIENLLAPIVGKTIRELTCTNSREDHISYRKLQSHGHRSEQSMD